MRHIIFLLSISLFMMSCGQNDTKQKELELKERELALKEKEFALKEKDSVIPRTDSASIPSQTKAIKIEQTVQKKVDEIKAFNDKNKSSANSKYTASGIIKSVEYERNDSWYILIVTPTANKVKIFLNPRDSEWDKVNLMNLKEGVKIGVLGEWEVWGDGTKGLNAKKIDFL